MSVASVAFNGRLAPLSSDSTPMNLLAWRMLVVYGSTIAKRPTCGEPPYRKAREVLLSLIEDITSSRWGGQIPASALDTLECDDPRIDGREKQAAFQRDIAYVVDYLGLPAPTELFTFPEEFDELAERLVVASYSINQNGHLPLTAVQSAANVLRGINQLGCESGVHVYADVVYTDEDGNWHDPCLRCGMPYHE